MNEKFPPVVDRNVAAENIDKAIKTANKEIEKPVVVDRITAAKNLEEAIAKAKKEALEAMK